MEQLYQTLYLLRRKYHFGGYIHVKAIPGADPRLIRMDGLFSRPYECKFGASYRRWT